MGVSIFEMTSILRFYDNESIVFIIAEQPKRETFSPFMFSINHKSIKNQTSIDEIEL